MDSTGNAMGSGLVLAVSAVLVAGCASAGPPAGGAEAGGLRVGEVPGSDSPLPPPDGREVPDAEVTLTPHAFVVGERLVRTTARNDDSPGDLDRLDIQILAVESGHPILLRYDSRVLAQAAGRAKQRIESTRWGRVRVRSPAAGTQSSALEQIEGSTGKTTDLGNERGPILALVDPPRWLPRPPRPLKVGAVWTVSGKDPSEERRIRLERVLRVGADRIVQVREEYSSYPSTWFVHWWNVDRSHPVGTDSVYEAEGVFSPAGLVVSERWAAAGEVSPPAAPRFERPASLLPAPRGEETKPTEVVFTPHRHAVGERFERQVKDGDESRTLAVDILAVDGDGRPSLVAYERASRGHQARGRARISPTDYGVDVAPDRGSADLSFAFSPAREEVIDLFSDPPWLPAAGRPLKPGDRWAVRLKTGEPARLVRVLLIDGERVAEIELERADLFDRRWVIWWNLDRGFEVGRDESRAGAWEPGKPRERSARTTLSPPR